jgi:hypothetical protein
MIARERDLKLLADYDFAGRNEAEIRGDWIEPLLRLLGYGLGTRHQILRERQLRLDPPVRMIGSSRYEIDFVPTVFGQRLWLIEAKRPQQDLFGDEHLSQAWSYATDPRVAVPLIVLCDGTRLGVFDVTVPDWTTPAFDRPKTQLPDHFGELFELLGAARVADAVRRRQLRHLRSALEAQVDLVALDRTVKDVEQIVADVRPAVVARREEIRAEARREAEERGRTAVEAAGIWGHAQDLNRPEFCRWADINRAAEIVRSKAPMSRVREFEYFEGSTTPKGEADTRMWFPLRALRMGAAALLAADEGCAEHCRQIALEAARQHADGFADNPLLAAAYRLQRLLGPLGWRMAAISKPMLDKQAQELANSLEIEEWLRLDGQFGVTASDHYLRAARLLPIMIQARIKDWSTAGLTAMADQVAGTLEHLPRPPGFDRLQPAADPWLDSWLSGDPLAKLSSLVIDGLPGNAESEAVRDLALQMRQVADETNA